MNPTHALILLLPFAALANVAQIEQELDDAINSFDVGGEESNVGGIPGLSRRAGHLYFGGEEVIGISDLDSASPVHSRSEVVRKDEVSNMQSVQNMQEVESLETILAKHPVLNKETMCTLLMFFCASMVVDPGY